MSSAFDPPAPVLRALVATALEEDLGTLGDITSIACIGEDETGAARFVAREPGVLAGTAAASEVYRQVDAGVACTWHRGDGDGLEAGTVFGELRGPMRSLLAGERVALNLLGHCSGVASLTRRFVEAAGGRARIRDTRKTLPGLRALEKAAVRAGGGYNHRDSLSDAVLVKDNHLSALGVTAAVERVRARWPERVLEVECDTEDQVEEAVAAGVDLLLLDNMTPARVADVVARVAGAARIEVSGGVTLDTVGAFAEAGADFISVGALTHSARALDVALDIG